MNITVYCGAAMGDDPAYEREALAFGEWIANEGHLLVWGCGDMGLMGAVSNGVLENGGKAVGVIPQFLEDWEVPCPHDHGGRLVKEITQDMATRRKRMIELGEAFVALPGGPGTLDEVSEVLSMAKFDLLKRPIILMNVNGYYNNLVAQLDAMTEHAFITQEVRDRVQVAANAVEAARLLS